MEEDHQKEEPSQTETQVGGDAAMDNFSTLPLPLPLDSSPSITPKKVKEGPSQTSSAETPTKRGRGRPPGSGSGSGSKKRKEGPSQTSSEDTPTKRGRGRPPGSGSGSKKRKEEPSETTSGISDGNFTHHVIELNAGQDVVDALYNTSVANYPKSVAIFSVSGSVSEIVNLTPNGPEPCKGEFQMLLLGIKCLVGDNGRHCREKAMCKVTCSDEQGSVFAKTSVNSLIAAGHVQIVAALFTTKKTCARMVEFDAAPGNDVMNPIAATPLEVIPEISDPAKDEGCTSGYLQTAPSATTSASNDQDLKSPSVGDNCQDMKSPS